MNILFYGGCHASVLKRFFEAYCVNNDIHNFEVITNFVIISKGIKFPFERLDSFDALVFNPILNKGDWNTVHIEKYCKHKNIKLIKYPWMQWGGYWPNNSQRFWGSKKEWGTNYLRDLAIKFCDLDDYLEAVNDISLLRQELDIWLDKTTSVLKKNEASCDVKYADWIYDNYTKKQLFLTPDHPSNLLYERFIKDIATLLGLDIHTDFFNHDEELQTGVRTPILSSVKKLLSLNFSSTIWQHKDIWKKQTYSDLDFIQSYHPMGNIKNFTSLQSTILKDDSFNRIPIHNSVNLLGKMMSPKIKHHYNVDIINMGVYDLYRPHWKVEAVKVKS